MFGRQRREAHGEEELEVDATLEADLGAVEALIQSYLKDPSAGRREQLVAALERLDQQIAASDSYEGGVSRSAAWGYAGKGSVIGETSDVPIAEAVPASEFRAQQP